MDMQLILLGLVGVVLLFSVYGVYRLSKLMSGNDAVENRLELMAVEMARLQAQMSSQLQHLANEGPQRDERITQSLKDNRDDMAKNRLELANSVEQLSMSVSQSLAAMTEEQLKRDSHIRKEMEQNRTELANSMAALTKGMQGQAQELAKSQENIRNKLDEKLTHLQTGNEKKLDEMRKTVDEHLQTALEKRITESFKTVSERLEAVHKGLGDMQNLASGVGDLKRVLTNVKSRGTFGEVQLEALIGDMLTPDQYIKNYDCGQPGLGRVEFGVRLPAADGHEAEAPIYLPIDAKFPVEDYERLLAAADSGDRKAAEDASLALERQIKKFAGDVSKKYINPPSTTPWAILFLPTEGLYAEILRRPGLFEHLQRDYNVTVAGPTNLQVLLSTFRMGYRQVAMNEQAHSVMQILGAVRSEFEKYGDQIEKMAKSLNSVQNHVEKLSTRRNVMLRALKSVEAVDAETSDSLLAKDLEPIS